VSLFTGKHATREAVNGLELTIGWIDAEKRSGIEITRCAIQVSIRGQNHAKRIISLLHPIQGV